jgi:hypothetical protein
MVEGKCGSFEDVLDDGFKALKHVGSRDPHGRDALFIQPAITRQISLRGIAHVVGHAVNLDGKFRARAVEIEDEGADRMLAAEAYAAGGRAKDGP